MGHEERAVAIPLDDGRRALEGIFLAGAGDGARGAVIAPPHPLYGGSMENPVVSEIAWACERAAIASLRFNWRGVGASAGVPSGDAADADADYDGALRHLRETVSGPLTACGYSFGAAAAVRVASGRRDVERLVLVAPPPSLLDADALAAFAGEVIALAGERDALAPARELEPLVTRARCGTFVAIPDADHFFGEGLAEIGRALAARLEGQEGE